MLHLTNIAKISDKIASHHHEPSDHMSRLTNIYAPSTTSLKDQMLPVRQWRSAWSWSVFVRLLLNCVSGWCQVKVVQ